MTHPGWKRRGKKGKAARLPYHLLTKRSALFEAYYRAQRICAPDEWPTFMAAMQV